MLRTPTLPRGARGPITLLLLAAAALVLAAGCGRQPAENPEAEAAPAPEVATPVRVITLAEEPFELGVHLSGGTEARYEVEIVAQLAGEVERFDAEPGDRLAEGDLILAVDARPYRAAVDQARAGVLAAESALRQADRELERSRELKARGRISDAEFEGVELMQLQAKSGLLGARAGLTQAELMLEDAEIRAPFTGRLAFKGVDVHEQIAPGMPVAAVVDLSGIVVRGGVGERDAVRLSPGMAAEVVVPALGEAAFPGRVTNVGVRSHPATRSFEVEIRVDNPEGRILSGMAARAKVVVETMSGVIAVPESAIVEQYGKPVLFVVTDGRAERREVSLGERDGDRVLVASGLAGGERLIVKGQWSVRDGLAVEIKN